MSSKTSLKNGHFWPFFKSGGFLLNIYISFLKYFFLVAFTFSPKQSSKLILGVKKWQKVTKNLLDLALLKNEMQNEKKASHFEPDFSEFSRRFFWTYFQNKTAYKSNRCATFWIFIKLTKIDKNERFEKVSKSVKRGSKDLIWSYLKLFETIFINN